MIEANVMERSNPLRLGYAVLDSDAHMSEPATLWTDRIERRFVGDAPRVVHEYKGKKGTFWVFDGLASRIAGGTGKSDMERPGGWDPAERLKDMAIDGIDGAVLYSTRGFNIFGCQNADLQTACFRVYNDWLAEFCSHAPDRFAGLAMISLFDIAAGTEELQRARKLGLKGAMIWAAPPESCPGYSSPDYDRFWAAAQDLGMPIGLHIHTRGSKQRATSFDAYGNWGPFYTSAVMAPGALQDSVLQMAYSGVFERFPGLKVIAAEGDINWMPGLMQRADQYYESRIKRGHEFALTMEPSDYIRRQVWLSFIKDPIGLKTYDLGGMVDRVMWSTDYPHPACFFPDSMDVIRDDFVGVPEADKRKILHDNCADLFGFTL